MVSVIIPCHGGAQVLRRALQSVRDQTRPPLETLVVDDGTPSPEAEELDAAAVEFGARLIRLPVNQGPGSARNAGWREAQGRYLAFLDSDDSWHPRKLELQLAVMESHPEAAMSGHDFVVARPFPPPPAAPPVRRYRWLGTLIRNPSATPTWMVRRDAPARFREGKRYVEDHLFLLELLASGAVALHIDAALATLFKPSLSGAGLSSHLWQMELGELEMYRALRERASIGGAAWASLSALSLIKFVRRALIVKLLRAEGG